MSTRCVVPFRLKSGEYVPCGKCANCAARRISGWSFRLMMEERVCSSAHFLTLTYAPENVRTSKLGKRLTLVKNDVQYFIRLLRKSANRRGDTRSIKYYAVGEYGTLYSRPHYHVLLFNASLEDLQLCWTHGQIHYGTVNEASVGYCLKYMCKERKIPEYAKDDRLPEFGLFSKGLGLNYITPAMIAWHKESLLERMYISLPGGKKIAMPRYYKEIIYTKAERRFHQLHIVNKLEADYKETYRSPSLSIQLKSFAKLRNAYESFNAESRKQRKLYFEQRNRQSIF